MTALSHTQLPETVCKGLDLSCFDPLDLRALYPDLQRRYLHFTPYEKQPLIELITKKLTRDFAMENGFIFSSMKAAYTHYFLSVMDKQCLFFLDRYADPQVFHMLKQAGRKVIIFEHCRTDDLKTHLKDLNSSSLQKVIFSSSFFSSTGKHSDLKQMGRLAREYGAFLAIDDSSTFGLSGMGFLGEATSYPDISLLFSAPPSALLFSLSFVCVDKCFHLDNLANKIKVPSIAKLHMLYELISLLPSMQEERYQVLKHTHRLKKLFRNFLWQVDASSMPSCSLTLNSSSLFEKVAGRLEKQGIATARPNLTPSFLTYAPTLLLHLNSSLTSSDVDAIFDCFNSAVK